MHNFRFQLFLYILIAGLNGQATGQTVPDSVIRQYKAAETKKERLYKLYDYLNLLRRDTLFVRNATSLINFLKSEKDNRNCDIIQLYINDYLSKTGDYVTSLASTLDITNRFEQQKDTLGILAAYRQLSSAYFYAGDRENDIVYGKKAFLIAKHLNNAGFLSSIANNISTSYSQKNISDSALLYARLAVDYAIASGDSNELSGVLGTLSEGFISANQYDSALKYARESLSYAYYTKSDELMMAWTLNDLSQIFLESNQFDSSKYYAHRAIEISAAIGFKDQLQRAYEYLSRSFHNTVQPDSALKYLQLAVAIKDSLYNRDKTKQVQGVVAREQSRLQEMEKDKLDFQNKIKLYSLVAGLAILGIVTFLLYRNNKQKQKANLNLHEQMEKVETTLQELKSTQSQLIQSEKMASLGELTAGIAHEIQNPLNFVNNFSEVNTELIDELEQEAGKGNLEEVKLLVKDIKANEQKINHHGKRADAIVKGMLQHSRNGSGVKELASINALADEYLRLAYHGLRAKDKFFNATMKTDYDESIGVINIIPQDIGRVILNLITNAFYAVNEKSLSAVATPAAVKYEPTVSVSTKKINGKVEIKVSDNGNGIPPKLRDKIFQPFFTTKPTGQGTGLGLSLAYDIVKAHGGELTVDTKEGEGTTFIILLPVF
jgi:signal transduction histidine kinase